MARHSSSWATKNIFFFFSDTRLIAYVLCQTQILQLVAQPEPTVERPQLIQLACWWIRFMIKSKRFSEWMQYMLGVMGPNSLC